MHLAKGDKWILIGIIAAILILFAGQAVSVQILSASGGQGLTAQVRGLGQQSLDLSVRKLPANSESFWDLQGAAGGLQLSYVPDKGFHVSVASCPDQVCVHTGFINKAGQAIICVPNQIAINLTDSGGGKGDALDGVLR